MAQLIPLPLTISGFSKIQIGFSFLVQAHPGSPGKRAVKRVCVCTLRGESGSANCSLDHKGGSTSLSLCLTNLFPELVQDGQSEPNRFFLFSRPTNIASNGLIQNFCICVQLFFLK